MKTIKERLEILGKEIEGYKKNLDECDYPRTNREAYYRIIDHFNYLVEQTEVSEEELDKLQKKWSVPNSSPKENPDNYTSGGEPISFVQKEEYWAKKRKSSKIDTRRKQVAIIQHFLAGAFIIVGLILSMATGIWIFLMILLSSLLLIKECSITENYSFIPRNPSRYFFKENTYKVYGGIFFILTIICVLVYYKESTTGVCIFFLIMLFNIISLISYDEQIKKP